MSEKQYMMVDRIRRGDLLSHVKEHEQQLIDVPLTISLRNFLFPESDCTFSTPGTIKCLLSRLLLPDLPDLDVGTADTDGWRVGCELGLVDKLGCNVGCADGTVVSVGTCEGCLDGCSDGL